MATEDIDALAQAARTEPRSVAFATWAGSERQTLAIVFTDIVGSTALNEELKDERYLELRRAHFAQSRKLIGDCNGCEIKTIGDAFLAAFRSADRALDFAIALHADPGGPDLRIRAGIHTGAMQPEEGDVFGREVNFGARVVGAIKDAEIWLSDPAMHDIDKLGAHRFADHRWELHDKVPLKGFRGEFQLWSLATNAASGRSDETVPVLTPGRARPARSGIIDTNSRVEFHADAQNYDRVDFVSSAEVVIDLPRDGQERGVYAQVDFVERLYVESPRARIEFGVRRAFVTVDNEGPGSLARADHLRLAATRRNASFVTLHDAPNAVSLCIDPDPGKTSLAELALPPTPRENYLCQIATATADVAADMVQAELCVSLDVEGLYLADDIAAKIPPSRKKQIEAIVTVAAKKNHHRVENGVIRRPIEIKERDRGG